MAVPSCCRHKLKLQSCWRGRGRMARCPPPLGTRCLVPTLPVPTRSAGPDPARVPASRRAVPPLVTTAWTASPRRGRALVGRQNQRAKHQTKPNQTKDPTKPINTNPNPQIQPFFSGTRNRSPSKPTRKRALPTASDAAGRNPPRSPARPPEPPPAAQGAEPGAAPRPLTQGRGDRCSVVLQLAPIFAQHRTRTRN